MIDAYCFSELHDLHSIIIPKQILGIDEAAFYDCQSLECIVFECESCKFGADVFSWCENLRDVVLPRNQQKIPIGIFKHCNHLQTIHIQDNVCEIESYAFAYCERLRDLTIPDQVKEITLEQFYDSKNVSLTYHGKKYTYNDLEVYNSFT